MGAAPSRRSWLEYRMTSMTEYVGCFVAPNPFAPVCSLRRRFLPRPDPEEDREDGGL